MLLWMFMSLAAVAIVGHLMAISADWFVSILLRLSCNDNVYRLRIFRHVDLPHWCHICKPLYCYRSALSIGLHCTVICLTNRHLNHPVTTNVFGTFQLISLSNSNFSKACGSTIQFCDKCRHFCSHLLRNITLYSICRSTDRLDHFVIFYTVFGCFLYVITTLLFHFYFIFIARERSLGMQSATLIQQFCPFVPLCVCRGLPPYTETLTENHVAYRMMPINCI